MRNDGCENGLLTCLSVCLTLMQLGCSGVATDATSIDTSSNTTVSTMNTAGSGLAGVSGRSAAVSGSGGAPGTGSMSVAPTRNGTAAAGSGSVAGAPLSVAAAGMGSSAQMSNAGMGGTAGQTANGASGRTGNAGSGEAGAIGNTTAKDLAKFSFFATSLAGLTRLAKSEDGFGGDLRYGEADGLTGADKICGELAEGSMPGAAAKGWRAFLSVSAGPDGKQVNAIDRVGEGPWYDRLGRVLAMDKASLLNARPKGADAAIVNDLPNEDGVPNMQPDPSMEPVNNHHFLTGSDASGKLYMNSVMSTCNNWTSKEKNMGRPRIGFSYPAGNRQHWISGQDEGGCGAGKVLVDKGGSTPENPIVGSGGGYGGFYCFALVP